MVEPHRLTGATLREKIASAELVRVQQRQARRQTLMILCWTVVAVGLGVGLVWSRLFTDVGTALYQMLHEQAHLWSVAFGQLSNGLLWVLHSPIMLLAIPFVVLLGLDRLIRRTVDRWS